MAGRKPKEDGTKMTSVLYIRVTKNLNTLIAKEAEILGMSISEYVRYALRETSRRDQQEKKLDSF